MVLVMALYSRNQLAFAVVNPNPRLQTLRFMCAHACAPTRTHMCVGTAYMRPYVETTQVCAHVYARARTLANIRATRCVHVGVIVTKYDHAYICMHTPEDICITYIY